MLAHLGVGFLLVGSIVLLVYSGEYSVGPFVTAGGFISAIGIVLSYVGLRANRNGDSNEEKMSYELIGTSHSLSHLELEMERFQENEKRVSGNRALAFVLISVGIFILGIAGFGLFILVWPLTLLGAGSLLGGIMLRNGY